MVLVGVVAIGTLADFTVSGYRPADVSVSAGYAGASADVTREL